MKNTLFAINRTILFICISMYFGTGWSLVLFSFPTADTLHTDNYYEHIVPQFITAAHFFTYMTGLMLLCLVFFIVEEWKTRHRWYPISIMAVVILATALTLIYIFPYNQEMKSHIQDEAHLQDILGKWMNLNLIRTLLWTIQWLIMMLYYDILFVKKVK